MIPICRGNVGNRMGAEQVDVVVIGAGVVGLSTAIQAALEVLDRVVCLDMHGVANSVGASGDGLRLFRLSYFEHAAYVPLLREAIEKWKGLGDDLYVPAGGLYAGPPESLLVTGSLESAMLHDIEYEILNSQDVSKRFPQFSLPHGYLGFLETEGGYIRSKRATMTLAKRAESLGVQIVQEKAMQIQSYGSKWMVLCENGHYIADRVMVCAGAATAELVPGLAPYLTREPHLVIWMDSPDWTELPGFGIMNEAEEMLYGFPAVDAVPGVKVGGHHNFSHGSASDQQRGIQDLTARFMPKLSPKVVARRQCDYDMSPDGHFMIGELEQGLTVACGFSGHGFKFGSVIGELVCHSAFDCLEDQLSFLDVNRFTSKSGLT